MGPKWPICPEQNLFGTNQYYYFHLPIGPFHSGKFKKYSYSGLRVMRMCHFWDQTKNLPQIHLPQTKSFLESYIIFIYLLAPFIKQNFYSGSRIMRMLHFLGQNGRFAQRRFFFRKLINKPCSFHSCLSTCQKSKSDINQLMRY